MIINHNMNALNAHRNMTMNTVNSGKSMEKLSSGLRINRAGDDAAGLAISEKMRGQIRGLDQAQRNSQDGISLIQTAEGALNETHSILQRMRELSVQSSNDTNNSADRGQIQKEIDQLTAEIDRIAETTEFNTKKLLNGGAGLDVKFTSQKVGAESKEWISVTGGNKATSTGTIDLTGAQKATGATVTITAGVADKEETKSITINGKTISYQGSTVEATNTDNLAKALNAVADELGIKVEQAASGSDIKITTNGVGSNATLKVDAQDKAIGSAIAQNVKGNDASLAGVTATEYVASGNNIKFVSGKYEGLELKLNSSLMSDTSTNNTATFEIKSNGTLSMQIGANEGQTMNISINDMSSKALGVDTIDVSSAKVAGTAVTTIQDAIDRVSDERSKLGAYQNRLEHTINNLGTSSENLTAAESRVRDVDMAKEMMAFSKNNILSQAAQAMLAQANQQPQGVLQLLR